jgi:hypothetical protein
LKIAIWFGGHGANAPLPTLRYGDKPTDLPDGQISSSAAIVSVQPCLQKYSASGVGQIKSTTRAVPFLQEGRFAVVTNVGCGMQWTRQHQARE